jgi:hypothetical protein
VNQFELAAASDSICKVVKVLVLETACSQLQKPKISGIQQNSRNAMVKRNNRN